jgi:hypothetical protein
LSRSRTAAELLVVYALLAAILWRAGRAFGAEAVVTPLCGVAIAALVLASWRRTGATFASLGLAPPAWRGGWTSAAAASLAGAASLAAAGIATGHASLAAARFSWIDDYALGIAGQQLLLQGFFAPGFARLAASRSARTRGAVAVGAAALAFAGLHAPNPGLMVGTALAGAFWVVHFRAHHNLPAVLASHLVLGLAAMASLGPGPLWNLRVGAGALDLMSR